jgi:hypothetical protein
MLAIVAAVIFGLALLLDLADATVGDAFDSTTLLMAGMLCLSLHLAGVGTSIRRPAWRGRR